MFSRNAITTHIDMCAKVSCDNQACLATPNIIDTGKHWKGATKQPIIQLDY